MPLYANAVALIRSNLEAFQRGERASHVTIGTLSTEQVAAINASRASAAKPQSPINGTLYFIGRHIYERRIVKNGYTIDDVVDQIASALGEGSRLIPTHRSTVIQNHVARMDRYGNLVQDQAVLECTARNPQAQLYSVIPKGDGKGGD
jgi:hypothetical protein